MHLPKVERATLEKHLSGVFDNSPLLQSFPIIRWIVYRACNLSIQPHYPSALESLSRLGLYLSAVGFSVSLLNCSIIPIACCSAIMMIFRSTIIELRKQAQMTAHIERLETVHSKLEKTLAEQKQQVINLQATLNLAHITTQSIIELKKKEEEALKAWLSTQAKLEAITKLLEQERQEFSKIRLDLKKEVDRIKA